MARADDLLDFYGGDLGPSRKIVLGVVSAAGDRLTPGRWLVQLIGNSADRAWVKVGPYSQVTPVSATADAPSTPMGKAAEDGRFSFELNVRPNFNDQIAGIMEANAARLILTPISRVTVS